MADITLERIAELEMLRAAVGRALEAYSASNRDEALALNHDGANLVYMANLANSAPALLEAARRLLELERKALRVTHRDVTLDEIEHVTRLAIDARNALLTPGGSSAPIVRWLMWQEDRGLAVVLELLQRNERLLELEAALEFMARTHVDCLWEDTEGTLRLAREFGWTPPGESK